MTSYQRLKNKLKENEEYVKKILLDPEFYMTESIALKMRYDLSERIFFGEHKPTGEIEGLLNKLTKEC